VSADAPGCEWYKEENPGGSSWGNLSLSGRVLGGEGHDSLWIDLAHPDGTPLIESARIENGAFRLDRLQPGIYQLRVATYDREVKVLAERTVQLPAREELVVELAPEKTAKDDKDTKDDKDK